MPEQIRIDKKAQAKAQGRKTTPVPLDLRTPNGKKLPY